MIGMAVPKYVVNVDVAVARAGEYLFIERAAGESHAAGTLAFPGGKVEDPPDEDDPIAATARREVSEETGVTVEDVEYVLSNTFESDDGQSVLNVVVRGEYASGTAHVRAEDEVAAVHWLSPDTLDGRDDVPPYLETYVERVEAK